MKKVGVAQICKRHGLENVNELIALTKCSRQTLQNLLRKNPYRFELLLMGALELKRGRRLDVTNRYIKPDIEVLPIFPFEEKRWQDILAEENKEEIKL